MQSQPLTWLGLGHTQPPAAMFSQGNPFASRSSFETLSREPMLFPVNTMPQMQQPMQQPMQPQSMQMQQPMQQPMQPQSMQMQQMDQSGQSRRQRRLTCASQDSEMIKSKFTAPTALQRPPSPQPQVIAPQQGVLMNGGMQQPMNGGTQPPMNGAYQQWPQQQQPQAFSSSGAARRAKRLSNTMEPALS